MEHHAAFYATLSEFQDVMCQALEAIEQLGSLKAPPLNVFGGSWV